ncbi:MAG: hypothetical protein J0I32_09050 [Sphingobacteriales bacterium]|mgnify:CR=1 FL=1|nr:hypothetical protein [Sphingobacteriales bacterium]OJW00145.1 MAG: hypothetical protein BGO52_03395 [Sphingobacteriales bacterium 44-61]
MSVQSIVRLNAAATVNPRDWELFKQMVAETKAIVASEGPDHVLTHECYFNPETYQCLIVEAYASEESFLHHLEQIRPLSEKYQVDWKIDRLELLGPYSPNVVEAMAQGVAPATFSLYQQSLQK